MIGERPSGTVEGAAGAVPETFGFALPDEGWLELARRAAAAPDAGFLGPYRVLGRVGAGAQGVVFRAVQPGTGRVVALKRLAAGRFADADCIARVRREIEATVALSHPGIVTLHGIEVVDGLPILVMEFVDGVPISQWAHPPECTRPLRERLAAFLQCCDAMAFAHSRAVIHCDLKPGNILVDSTGRVRVVDFGLARLQDQGVTSSGFRGTPAYAPPEQLARRGHVPDSRSDVYSLGAVLYVLVTGRPPFDTALSVADLIDAVRTVPPAPFDCRGLMHRELRIIIHKAMAKSPEERYQSAHALASDIRRLLDGRPILAHPPSALYQVRAFVRRRPIACATAAAALLAIVGLAVTSTALAMSLENRRQQLHMALEAADDAAQDAQAQANEARRARADAEAEARRAHANAEFMLRFLEDLAGAVQRGDARPDPRLLAETRERLETEELESQPEVQAVLWRTLGLVYVRFGRTAAAAEIAQTALQLHLRAFGAEHAETGRCYYLAGLIAEREGDMARAEAMDREAVRILSGTLGELHTETALAVNNLGCVLKDNDQFEEAERCHRRALATWRALHGDHHRYVAMSLRNFGTLERSRGRYELAETYYEQAMQTAIAACSPRDPLTDSIRQNIARLRFEQGDVKMAEQICRSIIERSRVGHGEERSFQLGRIYLDLGRYVSNQGKHAEALGYTRDARPHYVTGYGEISRSVYTVDLLIGDRCVSAGDEAGAASSYRRALRIAEALGLPELRSQVQSRLDRLATAGPRVSTQDQQP